MCQWPGDSASSAVLLVAAAQEPAFRALLFQLSALLDPMPTLSTIQAFDGLGVGLS